MAIGTVYGPPPTRNSGPGVVTLTCGVGVGPLRRPAAAARLARRPAASAGGGVAAACRAGVGGAGVGAAGTGDVPAGVGG